MIDGMATMTHRTTFALDQGTRRRLKRLASAWDVSQAEVVRRAVAEAEQRTVPDPSEAVSAIQDLLTSGRGITREAGSTYLVRVRDSRGQWRGA